MRNTNAKELEETVVRQAIQIGRLENEKAEMAKSQKLDREKLAQYEGFAREVVERVRPGYTGNMMNIVGEIQRAKAVTP